MNVVFGTAARILNTHARARVLGFGSKALRAQACARQRFAVIRSDAVHDIAIFGSSSDAPHRIKVVAAINGAGQRCRLPEHHLEYGVLAKIYLGNNLIHDSGNRLCSRVRSNWPNWALRSRNHRVLKASQARLLQKLVPT
jgi:hypothetical protein